MKAFDKQQGRMLTQSGVPLFISTFPDEPVYRSDVQFELIHEPRVLLCPLDELLQADLTCRAETDVSRTKKSNSKGIQQTTAVCFSNGFDVEMVCCISGNAESAFTAVFPFLHFKLNSFCILSYSDHRFI